MKRQRGRGRKGGGGGGQHQSNRALESNGPDVKVRGAAVTIYEKYQQLARDASSSGDRVKTENYLQHAEHYFRIMRAQEESRQQHQGQHPQGGQSHPNQGGQNNQNQRRDFGGEDDGDDQPRQQQSRSDNRDRDRDRGNGGNGNARAAEQTAASPLEVVTPEEGDLTDAASSERKPRRGRKPRAEAAEDAA